ncbi:hypothetical protein OGH69_00565 [Flavobacterium sp. MFBS3-15]|uniref:hypothetical protein n=1 Tax=Flavobacterium sp. MFBS3-15 TaxID=2989816 RepID=UPI002235B7B7|nr:hypothetical protein [Flavobacterium sp. MFBS3-15]MCW4467446.1 hypothetical protein [Flavobacterium sp. MFBS3-15]
MKKYYYMIVLALVVSCIKDKETTLPAIEEKSIYESNIDTSLNSKKIDSVDAGGIWVADFYKSYINFYLNSPNRKDKSKLPVFFQELDSIKKVNCTKTFFNEQIENFNKDFDYITSNNFICSQSLESLKISLKKGAKDTYVVSFIAEIPLNENQSEFKREYFDVSIVSENGHYKISDTCCF